MTKQNDASNQALRPAFAARERVRKLFYGDGVCPSQDDAGAPQRFSR